MHGKQDKTISCEQSENLAKAMKKHNKEYKLLLLDGVEHHLGHPKYYKEYILPFLKEVVM